VASPALVGRARELARIATLFEHAAAGASGAMLVSGDAGIGKTALVRHACERVAGQALILSGACPPLTSMTVPFLGIRSAVRSLPPAERVSLPWLVAPGNPSTPFPVAFDAWLEDLCIARPVILVVDDLQWADQGTLDVLTYVLAGPVDRPVAVVATIRSAEVGDRHPLQRWLGDIRRLPGIEQLFLEPLDRVATGAQIAGLLGASPHRSLVEDVYSHTGGNAYLNRLAVTGLRADSQHLAEDLPADLRSAVLQSWRRLSAPTQEATRILAIGGGPMHAQELNGIAGDAMGSGDVLPLLREAVESRTLDLAADGTYWFHHPLNAELLERDLAVEERHRWHSAFAEHYEKRLLDTSTPPVDSIVAVADHHHQAGNVAEAYRWALRASRAASEAGRFVSVLRLLRRAVELREHLPDAVESAQELLQRLMAAAALAGINEQELYAVDALLERIDRDEQPLLAAELLVRRMHLRFSTGREFLVPGDMREAARLSATDPASWQHAFALAELAHTEIWEDLAEAASHAERALAVARIADNPRALSYALCAMAMIAVALGHREEGLAFATESLEAAVVARDYWAYTSATMAEAEALDTWSALDYVDRIRRRREELTALGGPHEYVAYLSASEANSWLALGEWRRCLDRLRVALGSDPGTLPDVVARLAAARLSAWQGRLGEAFAHLQRADELFSERSEFLGSEFNAIRAEVHLAAGDPEAAFGFALAGAMSAGVAPTMCEWLIPLAARALADQIQSARDGQRDTTTLLRQLGDLLTRFPSVISDAGVPTTQWRLQIQALNELYAAEAGRARQDPGNPEQWVRTMDACHAGMLAWEEAYACWRAADALLRQRHHDRELAASVLRRGLDLADRLEAMPIQSALEELAVLARIHADTGPLRPQSPEQLAVLPGLTRREREVLAQLIAGLTYGQIAHALFISEKTVSSHISNLLRKTGTSNRMDLLRLATRAAAPQPSPGTPSPSPPPS
jgi:DNA-binding CsgD family transcriptional regulator